MRHESQINLQIPEDIHRNIVYINTDTEINDLNKEKIDGKFVHKKRRENVLISSPYVLNAEKKIYRTKVIVDLMHNFFFDHPLKHLPGMLLLEAARQFGTAISHLFFNAPFDSQFILHDLSSQFMAEANPDNEVFIDVMITDVKIRKGELRRISGVGYVHQNGEIIGKITSSWSIIPNKILDNTAKFH